jgi:drug/metabolite transporter (DMT)-like permease
MGDLLSEITDMIVASRVRDWCLLVICNLIWGSQFAMVKLVQEQMGPVFATFLPMTLATLLLIPFVHRWGHHEDRAENRRRLSRRDVFDFLFMGVLGQVGAQLFVTWGVRLSLASNAALVMLALPVATAVMAYFVLSERMTPVRWLSFILAFAGVLECSGINWRELNLTSGKFLLGNLMIFVAVNGSAFYNVYGKKLLHYYKPLEVLLYSNYAFFIFMLPIALYVEPEGFHNLPHYKSIVWVGLIVLTLFQYFLSMVIFLNVLTRLDATQAGLANYLIPFFGVVIAAIVLHERLTTFMVAGGILVLTSTLLVTVYEEKQRGLGPSVNP